MYSSSTNLIAHNHLTLIACQTSTIFVLSEKVNQYSGSTISRKTSRSYHTLYQTANFIYLSSTATFPRHPPPKTSRPSVIIPPKIPTDKCKSPKNHFLRQQGRGSSSEPSAVRRQSFHHDVSLPAAAALRAWHPRDSGTLDPQRLPEHRLPQLHRRLLARGQPVDDAAVEAGGEEVLPGDLLQGQLLSCHAVLQVPRNASGEHNVAGGERQAGEVHQRFRAGPRTLLDLRHRPRRRRPLLLDVDRKAHHLHQLERRRAQQLPVRERRGRELPRTVESGRQRPQMERFSLLFRNVFRVRSAVVISKVIL